MLDGSEILVVQGLTAGWFLLSLGTSPDTGQVEVVRVAETALPAGKS